MTTIQSAQQFLNSDVEQISDTFTTQVSPISNKVKGKALIIWDEHKPTTKRNNIDTDQITPAVYCVSENINELDKRWKEGAFRYLLPAFRKRVHQGENFLVVGDRFGIGSSREMSPAGLKAVAEEAGLELIIICGKQPGKIFYNNATSLGLYVIECPEAVKDAAEGDEFEFDKESWSLQNVTQNIVYQPLEATPHDKRVLNARGIFHIGRQEFRQSLINKPRIEWPDPEQAESMTSSEQILWAHRVDKDSIVRSGKTLRVYTDLVPVSDGTAPFAIYTFNQITGGNTIYPRQAAIINDHFIFTGRAEDRRQSEISQQFAHKFAIKKPYYAEPGDGIFHFFLPEQGLIQPGGLYAGADSHSRTYGAYGALGLGVGSTTAGFSWSTGYIYVALAAQRRVVFRGKLQPWVTGKDIVLALLRHWGKLQARQMGVEFIDAEQQLPIHYRHTISNMMAEAEAQYGIFVPDAITMRWYQERGYRCNYPFYKPGINAHYEIIEEFDLSQIRPSVACPFSPANVTEAEELAKNKLTFNKALIGSCTNGSYEDLFHAALVLKQARQLGIYHIAKNIKLIVYPGSALVKQQIELPDKRLDGETIAEIIRSAGGEIRDSWCGPCFGQGSDQLINGERAITTFNRNWQNRMGVGGEGYLASPAVVAASALVGYMASPVELGLLSPKPTADDAVTLLHTE